MEVLLEEAGVASPPGALLLRVYKAEKAIELWAGPSSTEPLTHVVSYGICAASGRLGPKRRRGDGQVPEGFYEIDRYNTQSSYYLAMQVSYPNALDRRLATSPDPGGLIMIHGSCASIGCLAISDERMMELWLFADMVRQQGESVQVHVFPARDIWSLIVRHPDEALQDFWRNLAEGHDQFEQTKVLPRVRLGEEMYRFE